MSEAFFIPLDPGRFFEEHDVGEAFGAPEASGALRFEARCMSCGVETGRTVELRGGLRGAKRLEWTQPVPMCERCQQLAGRRESVRRALGLGALGLSAGGAAVMAWGLHAAGWSQITLLGVVVVATALGYLLARAALGRWLEPWLNGRMKVDGVPLRRYREVELFYFRDPRKGEDARFLCVRIEDEERAAAFGRLNRHAIPSAVWDASFLASPPEGDRTR